MTKPEYVYQNFILDSTRWDQIELRDSDIVVVTPYKSGTTWVQYILCHLLNTPRKHFNLNEISPWVENRIKPIEKLNEQLNNIPGRRVLKTHLPADGIRIEKNMKYVYVGRDPRDVFISLWNQYSSYSEDFYSLVNQNASIPLPKCPENILEFWKLWLTKGTFDWEDEGYPHWSFFRHLQTWWEDLRGDVIFIHYTDLLYDFDNTVKKLCKFCEINNSDVFDFVSFDAMKLNSEIILPNSNHTYKKGNSDFFKSGTCNNWQGIIDDQLYHDMKYKHLNRVMVDWIEN